MPERFPFPPEVKQEVREWELKQKYNPESWEKVEHNLRATAFRRTIPITAHYWSNFHSEHRVNDK